MLICSVAQFSTHANTSVGLPLIRLYSLDEIGGSEGGFELGFDPIGRLTVVQNGSYSALNDRDWVPLFSESESTEVVHSLLHLSSEEAYYGANGSWGRLVRQSDGRLAPEPMLPADRPDWAKSNIYLDIFEFGQKIGFLNWNGMVFWDRGSETCSYLEVQGLRNAFVLENKLYTVSAGEGIGLVDFSQNQIDILPIEEPAADSLYFAVPFDEQNVLCATRTGAFFLFDGTQLSPWETDLDSLTEISVNITSVCALEDGHFAVSIAEKGLYLLDESGNIQSAYTTIEYRNVEQICYNEPGILWVSNYSGILQVFYGSPVGVVDKRQGLIVNWPQITGWRGKTVIASGGILFESNTEDRLQTTTFKQIPTQPTSGIWGIASDGETLLVSDDSSIYERVDEATFEVILDNFSADRLVMPKPGLCYAIHRKKITILAKQGGRWQEVAKRQNGYGYPSVVHAIGQSAWVELGVQRVLRISYQNGELTTQLFDEFPWKNTGWIHISSIDDLVILSSPGNGRLYFDESQESFIEAPEKWEFLDELPYLITRVRNDSLGNIWMSHHDGIALLKETTTGFQVEAGSYDFVRASDPIIRIMDEGNVWFNNGENLFHLDPAKQSIPFKPSRPRLISIHDQLNSREIADYHLDQDSPILTYDERNLAFRFFAGTYSIRNPRYNIRVVGRSFDWSIENSDSELLLTNLFEGNYELSCQLVSNEIPINTPIIFRFQIAPPWYRTPLAYFLYFLSAIALLITVLQWFLQKAQRQNKQLSKLVKERTKKLEETMEKLQDETRNSATLTERNRLAAELHDSVQQGLNGLMIHMDGMMLQPLDPEEQQSSMRTAKKMLDYTRQEVKYALRNMRSPLIEDSDLARALSKVSEIVASEFTKIELTTQGEPYSIPSYHLHQLLRICQEAVTNAITHGKAERVLINQEYSVQKLRLIIEDNGSGFDPQKKLDSTRHFGIYSLENRAKSIDAELTIDSKPGEGTRVSITIPKEAFYQAKT